jgi:uncharacterized protein (TIRG00374 family)
LKRLLRVFLTGVVLVLLFVPVLRSIDGPRFTEALRGASLWPLVAAAVLALMGCLGASTLRIGTLLAALPSVHGIRLRRLYQIYIASAAAQILLPSPAAEILRTVHLAKRHGYALEDVTAAHIVEKAVDAIVLSLCVVLLATIGELAPWMRRPFTFFVSFSAVGVILIAIFARREVAPLKLSTKTPISFWRRIQSFLHRTVVSLNKFHSVSTWVAATAWSCVSEATNALTVGLVLAAVGQPSPIATCLAGSLTARLSGAVPLTPGQLGVQEGSVALVLSAFGVEPSRAMAAALLYRAVHAVPTLAFGGLALRKVATKK